MTDAADGQPGMVPRLLVLHRLEFQRSVAGRGFGATMQRSAIRGAVAAAKSTASSLGLTADEAIVSS
jgi:hypothetical protein